MVPVVTEAEPPVVPVVTEAESPVVPVVAVTGLHQW